MVQILIADDDERMRKLLRDFLVRQEYTVAEAGNGHEALEQFHKLDPLHLVILDIMMPGLDGWEVCRKIRESSSVPILFLTAKGEEYDELFGFQIGASDYITKPFSPSILVARVGALLSRVLPKTNPGTDWVKQGLRIQFGACRVFVDEHIVELSPREYDLLIFFVQNEGIVLMREVLLEKVWGYDYFGDPRTVDTHINRLRLKISPYDAFIQTIRGKGYRFEGQYAE